MKKRIISFILMIIITTIFVVPANTAFSADDVIFDLTCNTFNVKEGNEFEIMVKAKNVVDVYAFEIALEFDPEKVEYKRHYSQIQDRGISPVNVKGGKLLCGYTKIGDQSGENGDINLYKIIFKAKSEGTARIKLNYAKFVNSAEEAITYNNINKEISITITESKDREDDEDIISPQPGPEPEEETEDETEEGTEDSSEDTGAPEIPEKQEEKISYIVRKEGKKAVVGFDKVIFDEENKKARLSIVSENVT